ncbi:transposase, partial [Candidatus Collierbacteria bacterium]|nr:transposase [Candidatus Collierbacteria bacterium]
DVMGKIRFPHLGYIYLIASIDDHSRFVLSSNWYERQTKQNVFFIWYAAIRRWGIPKAMLQDRGSQYKANTQFGQADYQYYAGLLKIELIWARKAQTKGKIERFWRFVQQDFVRENLNVNTLEELNQRWNRWVAWYNFSWKGAAQGLDGKTPAQAYRPSDRKTTREEKVSRENTISLYGRTYPIPKGYIGARIWVKLKGNKLLFEAKGRIFWKQRLKP